MMYYGPAGWLQIVLSCGAQVSLSVHASQYDTSSSYKIMMQISVIDTVTTFK